DHGLTGANRDRPGLAQALAAVRSGDTLVVPKLDRLARSVPDARDIGDSLAKRGVALSLGGQQIYDPNDPMGKMFFNILATFAEFELDLIRARTREGMAIAKAKGKLRGRQPKLSKKQQAELVRMYNGGEHTSSDLADIFKVSRATIYRTLKRITPTPTEPPAGTDRPTAGAPSSSSADTVVAGKSYRWVVELVPVAGGSPLAWSGHTTETGAERMLASIAKVWSRQGSQIRSRWLWGTARAEGRQPLFANRQQVLRHAGDVMCFDSAPDWGDDAVLTSAVADPAKGLVAITIEPGNRPIGEPLDGVYDTTRLNSDDHWHGLYLTDLVTALF
ncbi:MAG: recombinase family protein, partial [Actinomycetia bacterium]|nr:recombinase family protein [Actinomycetes bacterium]